MNGQSRSQGFWRRTCAMLIKEFIQLRRDRISFAMIIMIPLIQLMLFGYAINSNPRHLPTAVLLQEQSDVTRSILKALENTAYFKVTHQVRDEAELDRLLASGTVLFAIEVPANFERAVRRGDHPALLVAADATDPLAAGSAISALNGVLQSALRYDRAVPETAPLPFEIRSRYVGTVFGLSWAIIYPFLFLGLYGAVYALILQVRLSPGTCDPYQPQKDSPGNKKETEADRRKIPAPRFKIQMKALSFVPLRVLCGGSFSQGQHRKPEKE